MSQPALRKIATLGILLLALSLSALAADDCAEWKLSYAGYEDEVQKAIKDEPEDLPKELRRHAKAVADGHDDQAMRIDRKIRGGLVALRAIEPHPDMTRFHTELLACYQNGIAVLDASNRGDGSGGNEAEIRTWQAFRRMIVSVRDMLAEKGCDPEEVEAIDRKFLGQIDAEIEALKSGTTLAPSR
jgi:hypothetical protein